LEATLKTVLIKLLLILSLTAISFGATIGTITSNGRFEMEGATIWNRGTLLEGSRVTTGVAASRLFLDSGSSFKLGTSSSARVYANRVLLETGTLEGTLPSSFHLETAKLGLRVEGDQARAQLRVGEGGKILIASIAGELNVRGPRGVLVARLQEGNALEMSASAGGATASMKVTGTLKHKDGRYTLTDELTGVTSELRGDILAKWAGKRVVITGDLLEGAKPVEGAAYVVLVKDADNAAAAALTPGKAGGVGVSKLTKVVVVAGIAVAGGVTAGVVSAGEDTQETVSPQP
jgi:hypothetical protein